MRNSGRGELRPWGIVVVAALLLAAIILWSRTGGASDPEPAVLLAQEPHGTVRGELSGFELAKVLHFGWVRRSCMVVRKAGADCVDQRGEGITHMTILVRRSLDRRFEANSERKVRTDANGAFDLAGLLPGGLWRLS